MSHETETQLLPGGFAHKGRVLGLRSLRATGYSGSASATGIGSKAMGGPYGVIALAMHVNLSPGMRRREMRCDRIGCGDGSDGLLKAHVWYSLTVEGKFVEVSA
jgi:hypothetical protein